MWDGRIFHFFLLLCYLLKSNSSLSSVLKVSLLLLDGSFLGLCVYMVCVSVGACTQGSQKKCLALSLSTLSFEAGSLTDPGSRTPACRGQQPSLRHPSSTAGFLFQCWGSHSGPQAFLATALTTELSPSTPATVLPELHFPISTWQGRSQLEPR